MRHLYGVALAVLLAAAVFFGAAWGYMVFNRAIEASAALNSGRPPADGGGLPATGGSLFPDAHLMVSGAALLAVGLAAGLLMMMPRVSPLAAGLPGLVLVAWTALYVSDVGEAVRLIPLKSRDFGAGFEALLFAGLLGAAGLAMIVPLFISSRWRRPSRVPGYPAPGESTLGQPATAAPGTGESAGMGGSGLDPTIGGFTTPSGGDSSVLPDWAQGRPRQGPVIPPGGSQAPWGPPDQG
jgi:hypothetical protein